MGRNRGDPPRFPGGLRGAIRQIRHRTIGDQQYDAESEAQFPHLMSALRHFWRRTASNRIESFERIYRPLARGALLAGVDDSWFTAAWARARADTFVPAADPPLAAPGNNVLQAA